MWIKNNEQAGVMNQAPTRLFVSLSILKNPVPPVYSLLLFFFVCFACFTVPNSSSACGKMSFVREIVYRRNMLCPF